VTARSVVVTGSTRGIGLGLARELLARDCDVTVVGTSDEGVERALRELGAGSRAVGVRADVRRRQDHEVAWERAVAAFGRVDLWVNNAGLVVPDTPLWETSEQDWHRVVDTNLLGTANGSAVAARHMLDQGSGYVWNMEGFGADGMNRAGVAAVGSSKRAIRYLTRTLVKDLEGTPVGAGLLSPGIVVTDLLDDSYAGRPPQDWERAKRILSILADRVETVTPFLAERMLATERSGERIAWLTKPKILARFAAARFTRRDPFTATGA